VNNYNDEFDRIINPEFPQNSGPEYSHTATPYGGPPVKPGLTRRGKIAIAVAAAAIAGTGFFWYQAHSAQVAKDQKDAATLQIQMKKLELEEMRLRNDQKTKDAVAANSAETARQASIDKCVKDSQHLVGKGYGSPSKSQVIADCQQQYGDTAAGDDMAAAGSATSATGGGGSINSSTLLGLAAGGGLLVAVAAKRSRRSHAA
jgi:hypothetical protein